MPANRARRAGSQPEPEVLRSARGRKACVHRCERLIAMGVKLNHTIVHARDKRESAAFYAQVFGFGEPVPFGPFLDVETANEVTLAILESHERFDTQHYAFLVSDEEFDRIFARVTARGLDYWADPARSVKGELNRHFGGRGVYFEDPSGHLLEIITRPYGRWEDI